MKTAFIMYKTMFSDGEHYVLLPYKPSPKDINELVWTENRVSFSTRQEAIRYANENGELVADHTSERD